MKLPERPVYRYTVARLARMTPDITLVGLKPEEAAMGFLPGQYAKLTFDNLPSRDYSIANLPGEPMLEFHIRNSGSGPSAHVAERLRVGEPLSVQGPYGQQHFRPGHAGPVIAIAGGSGLAPIKSIVEATLAEGLASPVSLYFGGRGEADIYLEAHFAALSKKYPHFTFTPVLSEPQTATGRPTGYVGNVAADSSAQFADHLAYLAGPPAMVESAGRLLLAKGIDPANLLTDAFFSDAEMKARLDAAS
jgi:CDP-4-dehydro-6-deoxyglucose reductase/ferredoxin-NAD(P)+ reductase (naphthalene dioxygenase ferredoxin-specific)